MEKEEIVKERDEIGRERERAKIKRLSDEQSGTRKKESNFIQ